MDFVHFLHSSWHKKLMYMHYYTQQSARWYWCHHCISSCPSDLSREACPTWIVGSTYSLLDIVIKWKMPIGQPILYRYRGNIVIAIRDRFIRVRIAVCESKFTGCDSLFVFYRPKLRCTGHAYRYVQRPFCTLCVQFACDCCTPLLTRE